MTGISIFVHAVKMALNNLGPALRIGALPVIIMVAAGLMLAGGVEQPAPGAVPELPSASAFGGGLLLIVVQILVSLWVAVAWHRYILLEEQPGAFLPQWNGAAIWAYFKASIIVGLLIIAAMIPLSFVVGGLAVSVFAVGDGQPGLLAGLVLFLVVALPLIWLGYRLGPMLAGAAVGDHQSLGQAWRATSRGAVDILILAFISVLALWVPLLVVGALPAVLAVTLNAVLNWASVMVGVGIITTIYGHYVQGRSLNA